MTRVSAIRYFLVVSPPPTWLSVALAASVIIGCVTLWLNPADVDSAYGAILLLQMFGVSSGYSSAAARGHFDPVLVGHRSRVAIALGHLMASAAPGVAAWLVVAAVASALGHGAEAMAASRTVALLLVSTLPWAAGLPLPRLAAGALWSLILIALAMSRWAPRIVHVVDLSPRTLEGIATAAVACAACPFLLLGRFAGATDPRVLSLDLLVCLLATGGGVLYVARRDYPLAEPA